MAAAADHCGSLNVRRVVHLHGSAEKISACSQCNVVVVVVVAKWPSKLVREEVVEEEVEVGELFVE